MTMLILNPMMFFRKRQNEIFRKKLTRGLTERLSTSKLDAEDMIREPEKSSYEGMVRKIGSGGVRLK